MGAVTGRRPAIVFDLDGVLIDSRRAISECLNATLAAAGLPTHAPEDLHPYIGPPLVETFTSLTGGPDVDHLVLAYRERYAHSAAAATTVFDGIPGMLADLAADHRLAIATSKAEHLAIPLLDALGLADHFDVVTGPGDDDLHETKTQTLGRALARLGATEHERPLAMVGDRHHDIGAAIHHGLRPIGVAWGIGSPEELQTAGAHAIARTPAELAQLCRTSPS